MQTAEQLLDEIIEDARCTYPPHWKEVPHLPPDGLSAHARSIIGSEIAAQLGVTIPSRMIDRAQRPREFKEVVMALLATQHRSY